MNLHTVPAALARRLSAPAFAELIHCKSTTRRTIHDVPTSKLSNCVTFKFHATELESGGGRGRIFELGAVNSAKRKRLTFRAWKKFSYVVKKLMAIWNHEILQVSDFRQEAVALKRVSGWSVTGQRISHWPFYSIENSNTDFSHPNFICIFFFPFRP